MFESGDREKLAKLSVFSLSDLALFIPSKYEDNRLSSELKEGFEAVVECEVKSAFKKGKIFRLSCFDTVGERDIELIYFNILPYQKALFKSGFRGYFKGKVKLSNPPQLLQPRLIKECGGIDWSYPTKALKKQTIKALISKYLSKENLKKEGVPDHIIDALMSFHYPNETNFASLLPPDRERLYALKYVEIFNHLKKLSQKRRDYEATTSLVNPPNTFIESLPFRLSGDQQKAIEDIKRDISGKIAAKRIVVGDVGCGKSIVMFCSAFMALPHRSIIMAPTTVLANQLYNEAKKFLSPFLNVALFTQSRKEDIERADLIIGTHALLYTELPEAHLVMVDEQHRFGTNQRYMLSNFLKRDQKRVHYLQFSATPIPRTKAMINSFLVDFSFIKEMPFDKNIETRIVREHDFKSLLEHVKEEISKNHQVALVYPLVEKSEHFNYQSIDEARAFWEKNFEGVYVTHGKDRDKESVLEEFDKKGNILVSTTVIEVGISLNRLSTIIVVGAERLGFSQLHQLRGRVGRVGLKGYCFLFTRAQKSARLEMFAKTKSGFDIAELDLKFREGGDLLEGRKQSGKKYRYFNESEDFEIAREVKALLL